MPTPALEPPALPEVHLNLVKARQAVTVPLVSNELASSPKASGFVRHFVVDVTGTPLEGHFRVGQSFGVLPPGFDEGGKPHKVRLYSIASPTAGEDGRGRLLATPVKRLIGEHHDDHSLFLGVASNYMCDLAAGAEVQISGPNGRRFLLPTLPQQHDYLFFATGTGIAPFRGMLMELLELGVTSRVVLIMGAPYVTDLLYDAQLRAMAAEHPNVSYLTAISREPQADRPEKMYVADRLAAHADELLPLLENSRTLIYVCGVKGMEIGIYRALAQSLRPDDLARFLTVDREALSAVDRWDARFVRDHVKVTGRMFIEVY